MTEQPVLTLQQVARYLNVHRNTIYRLAQRGGIPAFKVGSDWRFNRESIDAWRLAQEKVVQEQISKAPTPPTQLAIELLDLIEWYFAEAVQGSVSFKDLLIFFEDDPSAIRRELSRMVSEGLLEVAGKQKEKQYRLTPAGLSQVRSGEEAKKNSIGHASFIRTSENAPGVKRGRAGATTRSLMRETLS